MAMDAQESQAELQRELADQAVELEQVQADLVNVVLFFFSIFVFLGTRG